MFCARVIASAFVLAALFVAACESPTRFEEEGLTPGPTQPGRLEPTDLERLQFAAGSDIPTNLEALERPLGVGVLDEGATATTRQVAYFTLAPTTMAIFEFERSGDSWRRGRLIDHQEATQPTAAAKTQAPDAVLARFYDTNGTEIPNSAWSVDLAFKNGLYLYPASGYHDFGTFEASLPYTVQWTGTGTYSASGSEYEYKITHQSWTYERTLSPAKSVQSTATDNVQVGYVYNNQKFGMNKIKLEYDVQRTQVVPTTPQLTTPSNDLSCVASSYTFGWSGSSHDLPEALTYELWIDDDAQFGSVNQSATTTHPTTSKQITGLSLNTTYWAKVRAKNSRASSPWSAVRAVKPKLTPANPSQVSPINNAVVATRTFTLNWTPVSVGNGCGSIKYRVKLRHGNSGVVLQERDDISSTSTSFTVTSDMSYRWDVQAYNPLAGTNSAWVYTWFIVDQPPVDASISGPSHLNVGQNGTFIGSATGGTGSYTYKWYRKPAGGSTWQQVGSSSTYVESYYGSTDDAVYLKLDATSSGETASETVYFSIAR